MLDPANDSEIPRYKAMIQFRDMHIINVSLEPAFLTADPRVADLGQDILCH